MPYLTETSLALSSLALVVGVFAATRRHATDFSGVYNKQDTAPARRSKQPDERRFTRLELIAVARQHNINNAKWRNSAKKAELFSVLTARGLI